MLDSPKRVTLAIDTDAEFWGLFRNSKRATDYVALLVGCEWRAGGCGLPRYVAGSSQLCHANCPCSVCTPQW